MLRKEDAKIIAYLLNANKPVSAEELSHVILVSKKTTLKRVSDISELILNHGAMIKMKKGAGFWLSIQNQELFDDLMSQQTLEKDDVQSEDYLIKELCSKLVLQNDFIKADDLAEDLYISRSKLTSLLNEARSIMQNYDLILESKPYYGLKVTGTEFNLRRFIASNYIQDHMMNEGMIETILHDQAFTGKRDKIKQIVQSKLEQRKIRMSNVMFENFLTHLAIMLTRFEIGQSVEGVNDLMVSEHDADEINLTRDILKEIEKEYLITLSESEYQYVLIHLVSKKEVDPTSATVPSSVSQMIEKILVEIKEKKNIDLSDDLDLRSMLGLHIVPLISRIQYKIELKNPLLDEIKTKCIVGYDLAIHCADIINQMYNTHLSENEISYFALHFDVAMNRQKIVNKKSVLLVCVSGRASAQMLRVRFEQRFGQYLKEIVVCDLKEVDQVLSEQHVDYIFTTVPFETTRITPVFEFDFFLNQQSVRKIQSVLNGQQQLDDLIKCMDRRLFFAGQAWATKEEVLHNMTLKISEVHDIPDNFEQLLLERESFYGTDFYELVAMPHPNATCTDKTFISIATLEKPILWANRKVRLIVLVSISKHDSEKYKFIFELLIPFLSSTVAINQVVQDGTFEGLIKEISIVEFTRD